jgi:transcription initiation factor IIE alpha subunit
MLTMKIQQAVNNPYFQSLPKARQKFLLEQQMQQGRKSATNMMYAEMSRDPEFREEARRIARLKKGLEE